MTGPPRIFDRFLHAKRLTRAAGAYPQVNFLKRRAAEDLVARLGPIRRDFARALDLGARDGSFAQALHATPAASKLGRLFEADLSLAMLANRGGPSVVADEERLPFAPASFDLVVSSLGLHWVNDLIGTLIQIRSILRPDGLFLGALLGGATLTELRASLMAAETELLGGAGPRVSPFVDAIDAGALLQRSGFALPVVDTDRITVRYKQPFALMRELRAMGEASALFDAPLKPLTRRVLSRACEIYGERFAASDGRITATFEIINLTGWAPHPDQPQPLRPGSAQTRLADALRTAEQSAGEPTRP
jgi:SAM-dependent methyltransferase